MQPNSIPMQGVSPSNLTLVARLRGSNNSQGIIASVLVRIRIISNSLWQKALPL